MRKIKTGDWVRRESDGFIGQVVFIAGVGEKGVRIMIVRDGVRDETVYERDLVRCDEPTEQEQREALQAEAELVGEDVR